MCPPHRTSHERRTVCIVRATPIRLLRRDHRATGVCARRAQGPQRETE